MLNVCVCISCYSATSRPSSLNQESVMADSLLTKLRQKFHKLYGSRNLHHCSDVRTEQNNAAVWVFSDRTKANGSIPGCLSVVDNVVKTSGYNTIRRE